MHFFQPIVTHWHSLSRALCQPHVITSSFDWLTGLSVSFVIGWSEYFGFGFTTFLKISLGVGTYYLNWFSIVTSD